MSIRYDETVSHVFSFITDTMGVRHRIDGLLTGTGARIAQVYPRHSVLYLSPPGGETTHHSAITVDDDKLMDILQGTIIIPVTVGPPFSIDPYCETCGKSR